MKVEVSIVTLGVSIVLISFFIAAFRDLNTAILRKKKQKAYKDAKKREALEECCLCGASKHQSEKMIAGKTGAVCIDCVPEIILCLETEDKSTDSGYLIKVICDYLSSENELESEIKDLYLDLLYRLKDVNENSYQKAIEHFSNKQSPVYLKQLLSKLSFESFDYNNASRWVWAHNELGEFSKAMEYPRDLREPDEEFQDFFYLLNLTVTQLELGCSDSEIEERINMIESYISMTDSTDYPLHRHSWVHKRTISSVLAECYIKLGNYKKAEEVILADDKFFQDSTDSLRIKGDLKAIEGDLDSAKHYWKQAMALGPKNLEKERLLKKLG